MKTCLVCEASLAGKRHDARYCSPTCRYDAWARGEEAARTCAYCDELANERDHVPPRSLRRFISPERYPFIVVACCSECNYMLGARFLPTVELRIRFLRSAYRMKYREIVAGKQWREADLKELGSTLKTSAIARIALFHRAKRRLKFLTEKAPSNKPKLNAYTENKNGD